MRVQEIRKIKFMATPEQSRQLQEALFVRGGYWGQSGPVVQKLHQPMLKLRKGALSLVTHGEGGYDKWARLDHEMVPFAEAMRLVCACEVPVTPRVVEVTMSEAFDIVAEAYDTTPDRVKFIEG